MADFEHGNDTVILIGSASTPVSGMADISEFMDTSAITRARDSHDTSTYGGGAHQFYPGLQNSTFTCHGWFDGTETTGSRAILQPLADAWAKVYIRRRPMGTGTDLPEELFRAVITSYVETDPAAGMIEWNMDCQVDGLITSSNQS